MDCNHFTMQTDRRSFLTRAGGGAGMIAFSSLRQAEQAPVTAGTHHPARAKRVLWLFMHGGPSHVDLFDPKPALTRFGGQPLPASFGNVMTRRNVARNPLLPPIRRFRPRGESGLSISDFLPHTARHADDLCVIRSLHGDSVNHPQSVYQMNTGSILMGNPSVGSWMGSENSSLPAFVVLPDPGGGLKGGPVAWGNGYLPASSQGVTLRSGDSPIPALQSSLGLSRSQELRNLKLLRSMNSRHLRKRDFDDELSARVAAYEMAFRMQMEAPAVVNLQEETAGTHQQYGLDHPQTRDFGQRCLLARRMLERGVRFVQVYSGDTNGWDAHSNVAANHSEYCGRTDQPIAALLQDLKQRGLLEDTLVIWGGEFGRMPMSEQGSGRDHNPWGFCAWLAGAGIRGGRAWGATDDIGLRAVQDRVSVNDLHATILHLLGIDHEQLTWFHNGLDKRLTGPDEAHVVHGLIG
ncbi:MAG: DUF1501 domain-containing protein [Planctomycetaceae bacterium]